jgi:hypothetical protein
MQDNSWGVSYTLIKTLENALLSHNKVISFERKRDILFDIVRTEGLRTVAALLLDEYTLGMAAVHRALSEFQGIDVIVNGSNWNCYTREAKQFGKDHELGIFQLGEFLGSLHLEEPYLYVKKDEKGNPTYSFRSEA